MGTSAQSQSSGSTCANAVAQALATQATAETVAAAATALEELAEKGCQGDEEAFAEYQRINYDLTESAERRTKQTRRWLSDRVFAVEERFIKVDPWEKVTPERFLELMHEEIKDRTRYSTKLSEYLFEGEPTVEDVKIFMQHQWYRSRGGYRIISDFAGLLDCTQADVFYSNVYEECGGGGETLPHPVLLARLIEHLGLQLDSRPDWVEAHTYINNRVRCVRNHKLGWGLALLWALEAITSKSYLRVIKMLERVGLPEEAYEFYTLHSTLDIEHAALVEQAILKMVDDAEIQQHFVTSLRRHLSLGYKYYDRIEASMRGLSQ